MANIKDLALVVPMCSVNAVVVNPEKTDYIVSKRVSNHWYKPDHYQLPGGMLEHGEKIVEGVLREIYEETGLKVEIGPYLRTDEGEDFDKDKRHWVCFTYLCYAKTSIIPKNPEPDKAGDWEWYPFSWPLLSPHMSGLPIAVHQAKILCADVL